MKLLKFLFPIVCCMAVVFSACKKETDVTARISNGSLRDSSGNCYINKPHGDYVAGTTLVSTNYIDFHVKIDTVGTYTISTDTVNGYMFKGTGTFGVKGDTLVRLYGHGTPQFGSVNVFNVKYGASSCSATVTVTGTAANPATFSLVSDTATNQCSGAVVAGNYATRIACIPSNMALIRVKVTHNGGYNITVPTVNGLKFSGSGVFTDTGYYNLALTATGTPTLAGDFNYTVTVNGVSCTYTVTVADGPAAAVFTLGGSPSICTGFSLAGKYIAGTQLTNTNTVSCVVNVSSIGAYAITTNTVNGIHFSATGIFTNTGTNTVILTGAGTPTAAATNNFIVSASTGNCSFSVTTVPAATPPPITNSDYYPLTQASFWTYNELDSTGSIVDTFKTNISSTKVISGNTYNIQYTTYTDGTVDTAYLRKSGTEYHLYTPIDGGLFTLTVPQSADIIFLKEAPTGTTWSTQTFSGIEATSSLPVSIKENFSIANGSMSLTVNGVNYSNVIKVVTQIQIGLSGLPLTTFASEENYYAKGIGLIKSASFSAGSTTPDYEAAINHYKIN